MAGESAGCVKPTPVYVGFRRIWRCCRDFQPDSAETGSGSFWVGTDGLVIGVGFGDCYGLELTGLLLFLFFIIV